MTLKMLVKILLNLSFKQILSDVLETNHYPKNSKQSIMTRNVTLKLKRNKNLRKMSMMRTEKLFWLKETSMIRSLLLTLLR